MIDGGLGEHTERALRSFQRWAGLEPDGVAGADDLRGAAYVAPPSCPISLAWPLAGPIGDPFGPRANRFHAGVDILAASGTPVAAAARRSRYLSPAGSLGGWGKLVVVAHADGVADRCTRTCPRSPSGSASSSVTGDRVGAVGASATRPGRTCISRSGCAAPRSIRRAPCRNARFGRYPSGRGREALPDDSRADACAARGAGGDRAAGASTTVAPTTASLYAARARAPARGLPHRARRCSSSAAPAAAGWSRRSRTSARPATGCSWSRPATSASAGRRWPRPTASTLDHLRYPWGEIPSAADVDRAAARARGGCSSSSRTRRPRPAWCSIRSPSRPRRREAGALSVVDAVSSLGAVPLETDAWGLDVVAAGAQKALMTPPGPRDDDSASPAAWERALTLRPRLASTGTGRGRARASQTLDAPVTPPVSLVAGPERRARDAARGGPRGRLRAPPRASAGPVARG